MKNKDISLKIVKDKVSKEVVGAQNKNKAWWESLPMNYKDWNSEDRIPKTKEDFLILEKKFLNGNPYLRDKFNFNEFTGKNVLEIGCGSGAASCLFAKGGAKMTAVDITEKAVKLTKKMQKYKI